MTPLLNHEHFRVCLCETSAVRESKTKVERYPENGIEKSLDLIATVSSSMSLTRSVSLTLFRCAEMFSLILRRSISRSYIVVAAALSIQKAMNSSSSFAHSKSTCLEL